MFLKRGPMEAPRQDVPPPREESQAIEKFKAKDYHRSLDQSAREKVEAENKKLRPGTGEDASCHAGETDAGCAAIYGRTRPARRLADRIVSRWCVKRAYYFAPQGMTKVMNEGWACLVDPARLIFTDRGVVCGWVNSFESGRQTAASLQMASIASRAIYDRATYYQSELRCCRYSHETRPAGWEAQTTHRLMLARRIMASIGRAQRGRPRDASVGRLRNLWANGCPFSSHWSHRRRSVIGLDEVGNFAHAGVSSYGQSFAIVPARQFDDSGAATAVAAAMTEYNAANLAISTVMHRRTD